MKKITQGCTLKKISEQRVCEAFIRLSEKQPKLDFDLDTSQDAIEASVYINEEIELHAANAGADNDMTEGKATTLVNEHMATNNAKQKKSSKCLFCEGKQASMDCLNYQTHAARRSCLEQLCKCTVCFQGDHNESRCQNCD